MEQYARGDFSFIKDTSTRSMLQDAFTAVESVAGGWDSLLSEPPQGFMFSVPEAGSIRAKIDTALLQTHTGNTHSGYSYAWTMRMMQTIARTSWEQWIHKYRTSQQKN